MPRALDSQTSLQRAIEQELARRTRTHQLAACFAAALRTRIRAGYGLWL